jgi:uncharacterized protein
MTKTTQEKIEEIRRKTAPIFKKYPVKRAGLFGSFVRGEDRKDSDVDFLVEFFENTPFSIFDVAGVQIELQEKLQRDVDLVEYKSVKPVLKKYILPEEIRIYEKND